MSSIVRQGEAALWYLLGSPSNRTEGLVLAALCVLTVVLVLGRMERATDMLRSGPLMTVGVAFLGGFAALVGCFLVRRFAVPVLGFPSGYVVVLMASVVVSSLVVVPAMCILQRANVLGGAMSWGVSLLAAVFVVVIARTGFEVFEAGSQKARESKARSAEMEHMIDEP